MPKVLDRAVKKIKEKGMPEDAAYAIATKTMQKAGKLKPGTRKVAKKGKK